MRSGRWAFAIAALALAFALGRWSARERAARSPDAPTLEIALQRVDPLARAQEIAAALAAFGPEDVDAATAALDRHAVGVTPEEVRLLMLAWARFDAPGAFAWAHDHPGGWRRTLMDQAAYAWGYDQGELALRSIAEQVSPEVATWLRPSVLEGWLRSDDTKGASAYVAAVDDPQRRRRLTFTLAGQQLRRGKDALVDWVEGLPDDAPNAFKQTAFYHASGMLAGQDPQRAAEWFEAHRASWYSEGSLPVIARRWAEQGDAPALFAWLLSLPPDAERENEVDDAIASGFRIWVQLAPDDAARWLSSALPDSRFDPAVVELTRSLTVSDPAAAVPWSQRIGDATTRRRMLVRAGRRWMQRAPAAAAAWLAESDVPDEVRSQITSKRSAPTTGEGAR